MALCVWRGRVVSSERVMDMEMYDRIRSDDRYACTVADKRLAHMRGHLHEAVRAGDGFKIADCRAEIDDLLDARFFYQSQCV